MPLMTSSLWAQADIDTSTHIDLHRVYSKDEVDEPPHFPKGQKYFSEISSSIHYPADAREKGIKGQVMISMIVETDGSMTNARVSKGVYPSLDAEALRVAKLITTRMIPGTIKGIPVRSEYSFPIGFYLQ